MPRHPSGQSSQRRALKLWPVPRSNVFIRAVAQKDCVLGAGVEMEFDGFWLRKEQLV